MIVPAGPERSGSSHGVGGRLRGWLAAGTVGLCALFGIIIYVATDNGTVKITGTDDRMKVSIDGGDIRIENLGKSIRIRAGRHHLLVTRDGLTVKTEAFEINRGREKVLEVTYTRLKPDELAKAEAPRAAGSEPGPPSPKSSAPALAKSSAPGMAKSSAPAAPVIPSPRSKPEYITTAARRIKLKLIPAGEFMMGSDASDRDAANDESVVNAGKKQKHRVRITRPFYLGVTEVTRGQFRTFVDETGYKTDAEKGGEGGFGWDKEENEFRQDAKFTWRETGFLQTDEHPVVNVSWNDAVAFCQWLKTEDGRSHRLPTEAEWEYACRAGTRTRYFIGDDPEKLATVGDVADGTARARYPNWNTIAALDGYGYTAPVARFQANAFSLYDTHGNVYEWCQDLYDSDYYAYSPVEDPVCSTGATRRVIRGGSWRSNPHRCRSAYRYGLLPENRGYDLGFRVARSRSDR